MGGNGKKTWIFDSFSGTLERNCGVASDVEFGDYKVRMNDVSSTMVRFGLLNDVVIRELNLLVDNDANLNSDMPSHIAVLRIDVTCPKAYLQALRRFVPYVRKGGIVVIDDWHRGDIRNVVLEYYRSLRKHFGTIFISTSVAKPPPDRYISAGGKVSFWKVLSVVKEEEWEVCSSKYSGEPNSRSEQFKRIPRSDNLNVVQRSL